MCGASTESAAPSSSPPRRLSSWSRVTTPGLWVASQRCSSSSTPRERQRSASGFRPSIATERSFRSAASLPTDEEGHEAARDRRCRSRSRASTRGHRHRHSAPGSAGSRGRTLDTIADLTTYLKKKERLLRIGPAIAAAGEEELLARRDALTCAYS